MLAWENRKDTAALLVVSETGFGKCEESYRKKNSGCSREWRKNSLLFRRSRCDNLGVWRALTIFSATDFATGFGFGLQQKLASSLLDNGVARISRVYSFVPPWKQPLNLGRLHHRHLRRDSRSSILSVYCSTLWKNNIVDSSSLREQYGQNDPTLNEYSLLSICS